MMDETRINIYHGFDITYGTDESHTATEVPTTAGTYYAYVTPNASNTAYTGTAKSAAFTISPTAYNSGTVSVGDLKVGDILGPGVSLTKDTSSENSQFLDIDTIYGLIAALFRRGESFTASVTEEGLYAEYGYLYETDDEIDYETDDVTDDETDDETDIGTDGENRNVLVDTFRNGNNAYVVRSISYAGDEFNGYNVDWDSDEYILEQTTAVLPAVTEDDPPVSGGWEFSDIAADSVDASDKATLEAAIEGMADVTYEPKDVIAAQTVAGRNLAFLCKATPVTPNPRSYWAIVSVSMDLQGKVSLNKISAVDPADMKVKENAEESAPGSWTSEAKETAAELPESVQKTVGSVTGVQYTPIAVLGTQLAAGKNYCILAYGTTATASPVTSLYALYVYENPDGTAEVNAISALDLAAYVTPEKEFFASAEELGNMAKIDYEKKTGTACYVAESVLNADETEVTVKLTNADGTLLETYIIDPYTGEGKSASGAAVDLPQTGNTSPLAAAAASGALLMVLSGIFTAMRSGLIRKKDLE